MESDKPIKKKCPICQIKVEKPCVRPWACIFNPRSITNNI
jgi:hypothetical protein